MARNRRERSSWGERRAERGATRPGGGWGGGEGEGGGGHGRGPAPCRTMPRGGGRARLLPGLARPPGRGGAGGAARRARGLGRAGGGQGAGGCGRSGAVVGPSASPLPPRCARVCPCPCVSPRPRLGCCRGGSALRGCPERPPPSAGAHAGPQPAWLSACQSPRPRRAVPSEPSQPRRRPAPRPGLPAFLKTSRRAAALRRRAVCTPLRLSPGSF